MRPNRLKATIIMPTYNRGHTIDRALDSIRAQTYPDWELIVSNNGRDVYEFEDERIRVIDSSDCVGAAHARNVAIPHARGDIVGFFDDDDEMDPDYLRSFVEAFEASDAVQMVRCLMIHRGVLNATFGTPTTWLRRRHVTPTWEPIIRQDQSYFTSILRLHGFSEESGTLRVIPRPLILCHNDPRGGLREGGL
jgi:glycosyltransferase involved in cell wall biosynthesis